MHIHRSRSSFLAVGLLAAAIACGALYARCGAETGIEPTGSAEGETVPDESTQAEPSDPGQQTGGTGLSVGPGNISPGAGTRSGSGAGAGQAKPACVSTGWDPAKYHYPQDVVDYARSVCYNPGLAIGNGWPETKPFAYKWQEPRNNCQRVVYNMTDSNSRYTLGNAGSYRYKYSLITLGQWLGQNNRALTPNPWTNSDLMCAYMSATHDPARERADLYKQYSAGWPATEKNVAAWKKKVNEVMGYHWGPFSYQMTDNNGFMVSNAGGYKINQPKPIDIAWWKPAAVAAEE